MAEIYLCPTCEDNFTSEELAHLHLRVVHSMPAESIARTTFRSTYSGTSHIYHDLSAFLANYAYEMNAESSTLPGECHELIMSTQDFNESTTELVALLATSRNQRANLLALSLRLGCRDDPTLWECLQQDESHLLHLLQQAIQHRDAKDKILALSDSAAFAFLNLIDSALVDYADSQRTDSTAWNRFCKQAYRISVRLCERLHQLPESLHLTGVVLANPNHVASTGGAFADIYKGYIGERPVAVKTLRIFQPIHERLKNAQSFYREIALLHRLKHANICTLLGVDRQIFPGKICLISPWMRYGNIREFIRKNGFFAQEVHRFLAEIACGLAYLHQENVAHGDLRGPNILIDDGRHVKLGDFGLSNFGDSSQSSAVAGAVRWMAPETIFPERFGLPHLRYTSASDVYSFGHVCWEIYTDQDPFPELRNFGQVTLAVLQGQHPARASSPREFPDRVWNIMEDCWRQVPENRPSAVALKHQLRSLSRPDSRTATRSPLQQRAATNLSVRGVRWGQHPGSGNESTSTSRPESDYPKSCILARRPRRHATFSIPLHSQPSAWRSITPQSPRGPRPSRMVSTAMVLTPSSPKPSVRSLASVYPGANRLVPQSVYRPPTHEGYGSREISPCPLVMFYVDSPPGCGCSCVDAMTGRLDRLKDADEAIHCPPCVRLRILWPDYPSWSQVLTLPGRISRQRLAERVSQSVGSFIATTWSALLDADTGLRWRIGPGWITIADLELVGLQPVGLGDWQVHLRVRERNI